MDISLNGEIKHVPETCTIATLLAQLDLTAKRLAVEVNLDIVPRSQFDEHVLHVGDKVEIVHAIGGG